MSSKMAALILLAAISVWSQSLPGKFPGPKSRVRLELHSPGPIGSAPLIQTALNHLKSVGGGTLVLGKGVFDLGNGGVSVECSRCSSIVVEGSGDSTILVAHPNGKNRAAALIFLESDSLTFRKLRFRGYPLPPSAWGTNSVYHGGILFSHCTGITIDSVGFSGFYTGALLLQSQSRDFLISDCSFDRVSYKMGGDFGAVAIESGSWNGKIRDNRFSNVTHSAISAYGSSKLAIEGNTIAIDSTSQYSMGVYALAGLTGSLIAGNTISMSHNEGIILDGVGESISDNHISENEITARFTGITINEGKQACREPQAMRNTVSHNSITGFGSDSVQHGILLNRCINTRVTSNRISKAVRGVNIQNCSFGTMLSNNLITNSGTGINLTGDGSISGNILTWTGTGIRCDHFSSLRLDNNQITHSARPLEKGSRSGRISGLKSSP